MKYNERLIVFNREETEDINLMTYDNNNNKCSIVAKLKKENNKQVVYIQEEEISDNNKYMKCTTSFETMDVSINIDQIIESGKFNSIRIYIDANLPEELICKQNIGISTNKKIYFSNNCVSLSFKEKKGYKNGYKNYKAIKYLISYLIGKEVFVKRVDFILGDKVLLTQRFSDLSNFKNINGFLSVKEKIQLINNIGIELKDFIINWIKFYSNRNSNAVLNSLEAVYKHYYYEDFEKPIQENIIILEGLFNLINSKKIKLLKKILKINRRIIYTKNSKRLDIILKQLDKDDIESLINIRHSKSHSFNSKSFKKKCISELLSSSRNIFEIYMAMIISEYSEDVHKKIKNSEKIKKYNKVINKKTSI